MDYITRCICILNKHKVFTNWINFVLSSGGSALQVKELLKDLDDGLVLCTIAEALSGLV